MTILPGTTVLPDGLTVDEANEAYDNGYADGRDGLMPTLTSSDPGYTHYITGWDSGADDLYAAENRDRG